ncbi:MAG TPA: CHRD domain-containing protein [Chitinophagaceae bacterium]|nr:CHRD domain-containing protein [Chitinophagaceae bacterium]
MNTLKLTTLILCALFTLSACEKDNDDARVYRATLTLNAQQEVPTNPSTATGTAVVDYDQKTSYLNYTVEWSGLTDTLRLMHIHGFADPGVNAGVIQNIITPGSVSGGATLYNPGPAFVKSGKITGRLLIDGSVVKESDLLAGKLYFNIHSKTYPGGEIRAQIILQ